jgi:hypothetical protein
MPKRNDEGGARLGARTEATSPGRKGFSSRAAIPPDVLARLNAGVEEPQTLAEWLAVDVRHLLAAVLPSLGIAEHLPSLLRKIAEPAASGVMARQKVLGSSFFEIIATHPDAFGIYEGLAAHRSGIVREWGVWCAHLNALKDEPSKALPLLEAVRADASRYVQLSIANWLNDASKHQPDWVRATAERWLAESPCGETRWIVNHALRTLRKSA